MKERERERRCSSQSQTWMNSSIKSESSSWKSTDWNKKLVAFTSEFQTKLHTARSIVQLSAVFLTDLFIYPLCLIDNSFVRQDVRGQTKTGEDVRTQRIAVTWLQIWHLNCPDIRHTAKHTGHLLTSRLEMWALPADALRLHLLVLIKDHPLAVSAPKYLEFNEARAGNWELKMFNVIIDRGSHKMPAELCVRVPRFPDRRQESGLYIYTIIIYIIYKHLGFNRYNFLRRTNTCLSFDYMLTYSPVF